MNQQFRMECSLRFSEGQVGYGHRVLKVACLQVSHVELQQEGKRKALQILVYRHFQ